MPGVMEDRCVLIAGAQNRWSIAWHAALSLHREGARLAFSVLGEKAEKTVVKLAEEAGMDAPVIPCDAGDAAQVEALAATVARRFDGHLDGLVHSIANANRDDLAGEFVATSRDGFLHAHDLSVYTLIALTRATRPHLAASEHGSVVTLTYLGAVRSVPNYNVMGVAKAALEASVRYLAADLGGEGVRVNAVSAGPIKTVAAAGISGFDKMLKEVADRSPLRRKVDPDEVGDAVLFLLSPWARGITGQTLYVDCGYSIVGMP